MVVVFCSDWFGVSGWRRLRRVANCSQAMEAETWIETGDAAAIRRSVTKFLLGGYGQFLPVNFATNVIRSALSQ